MQFTLRVPEDHGARYSEEAAAAGFATINDYLAHRLAEVHGLEFADPTAAQQHLPLNTGREAAVSAARGSSAA